MYYYQKVTIVAITQMIYSSEYSRILTSLVLMYGADNRFSGCVYEVFKRNDHVIGMFCLYKYS